MPIEYLSRTGVVQTTEVEEPAPETGRGFFDSSQLRRRRSLSLPRTFPPLSPAPIPSRKLCQQNSAEGFARFAVTTRLQRLLPLPARRCKQRLCSVRIQFKRNAED
jgi:hypothetical protein